jgi:hypothetical protein
MAPERLEHRWQRAHPGVALPEYRTDPCRRGHAWGSHRGFTAAHVRPAPCLYCVCAAYLAAHVLEAPAGARNGAGH